MNNHISLSIITVCFNSKPFISGCMDNVISQLPNHEIEHLVIDGGSTDGSMQIIQKYAEKYSHIRYVSEPDKGQSDAMNKGISLAKADWIGFLNVDDFYAPFILKRVLTLISRSAEDRILVGNCKLINSKGDLIYINRPMRLKPYHFYSGIEPFPINPSAYFYKKTIHLNPSVGYYGLENHYNMDYEFFLKACLHYPIIYFNEDWGYMLAHEGAKTTMDLNNSNLENRKQKLLEEKYEFLPFSVKLKSTLYRLIVKNIVKLNFNKC